MEVPTEKPGIVQLGYRYTRALARWIKAGRPVRNQEEISEIYEICRQCRTLDTATNSCKYCGCRIGNHSNPLLNKIAMATERCPVGKWPTEKEKNHVDGNL